jgi:AcrR family transcriptional regulator
MAATAKARSASRARRQTAALRPRSAASSVGAADTAGGGRSVVERLIAAAIPLFAEQGYERTTVQEVVAAAGVTKGAMYHYFKSKDDLLYQIYHRILTVQTERLEHFVAIEGPIEERLRDAAIDVVTTTVENLEDLTIFFRSMHMLEPGKQRTVRTERRRYHELFRGMVEEGQRAGVFRADVTADLVVDYFFGAVHHLPTWFRPSGRMAGRELGENYARLLLEGLKTAPERDARRPRRK